MPGDWRYVTTAADLERAIAELMEAERIGVDTEADSFFHYRERVCLIQITGDGPDYVIDPLAIDTMEPLAPLFAHPRIEKIFHGADYDISSLKRDFGFEIRPVFDTMIAAQAVGHERFSLADLVERYFGVTLEKKYQRRDWSKRPLRDEHLEYARLDSHYLPEIRRRIWTEVEEAGRVAQVLEECRHLEEREWTDHTFSPDDFWRIRSAGTLDDRGKRVLRALAVMRDRWARRVDRPHFKVIANNVLLTIARRPPTTRSQLVRLLGEKHHVVRRYANDVLDAVREGLADETPLPRSRANGHRSGRRMASPEERKVFEALRHWRNEEAEARGVQPGAVIANAVLQEIAARSPVDVAGLEPIEDMRDWQREEYGERLLAVVRSVRKR